jgi:FixJ family two-component response regulator
VQPDERAAARHFLDGFEPHLAEAGIRLIREVFDAEPPKNIAADLGVSQRTVENPRRCGDEEDRAARSRTWSGSRRVY